MGFGLVLLEAGAPRGFWSGLPALVSLVPVALPLALGGLLAGGVAGAVAIGGAAALLGGSAALVVTLRHALPGFALGIALARRLPLSATLVLVSATSLLGLALLVWTVIPLGTSPLTFLQRQLDSHIADLEQMSARFGMSGEAGWAAESARLVAGTMRIAGPSVVFVGLLLSVVVNYVSARLCLRGQGFRPFAGEVVPDQLVWWVIAGGMMVASRHPGLGVAGLNLLIVLVPLYAIQGLAVLRYFFLRAHVPRPIQVVSFGLLALQPLLLIAVAGVGLSDLWVDFRKIRRAATPV